MNSSLEKKEDELKQSLARQLELFKVESEDWLKIGSVVVAGGLVAFAIMKSRSKRKDKKMVEVLSVLEREGLLTKEMEKKLTEGSTSTFWPTIGERLLVLGLAFAKDKFLPYLFAAPTENAQSAEEGK